MNKNVTNSVNRLIIDDDNRPVSEQKVDLHIYVVPPELWREHLQSAMNQVIGETISAGFIRVNPESNVFNLREEIENQIGIDLVPRDFVFLKCVGRCLTRIKPKQEHMLKVKNFVPPQSYAPEMFILESTPEIRTVPWSGSTSAQSETSRQNGYNSATGGELNGRDLIPPIKTNTASFQDIGEDDNIPEKPFEDYNDDGGRMRTIDENGGRNETTASWSPSDSPPDYYPYEKSTQTLFSGEGEESPTTTTMGPNEDDIGSANEEVSPLANDQDEEEDAAGEEEDPPFSLTRTTQSPRSKCNGLTNSKAIQTLSEDEMLQQLCQSSRSQDDDAKRRVDEEGERTRRQEEMPTMVSSVRTEISL